ncbi:YjbF family lipoprotein [Salipiger sp. H15]|uniref:YjbF family lipoprotein n=1 Tax=Alloyangia sp. H15 TaxID=3029062 RepID=A0AAU8AJK6_9RHOB
MTFEKTCRVALLAGVIASLAACGNDQRRDPILESAYATIFGGDDKEPAGISEKAVAQTLAATDLPVIRLRIVERKSEALALQIEQNGEHRTYATAERQAIVLRHGMITGTRGLGGDLMSVEEDRVLGLVRGRKAGQAVYVQRFLTPEDVTEEISYHCNVEPDKRVEAAQGKVRTTGTEMVAACTSETGAPFVDYYVVDDGGEIVASRQWLGETTGYITMQQLQR